jgi:hypothetical protein
VSALEFCKKHQDDIIRLGSALVICALMAVLIAMFRGGALPHAEDGDAFDTIYAIEQQESE